MNSRSCNGRETNTEKETCAENVCGAIGGRIVMSGGGGGEDDGDVKGNG